MCHEVASTCTSDRHAKSLARQLYPQCLGVQSQSEDPVDLFHSQGLYIICWHAIDAKMVAHGLYCLKSTLMSSYNSLGIQVRVLRLETKPDAVDPVLQSQICISQLV